MLHICQNQRQSKPKTIEAKILFDADKLESLGAIGIARSFIWIAKNNARIYHKVSLDDYIKENMQDYRIDGRVRDKTKHSTQMEYEMKYKFLTDKMFTQKGKELAQKRTKYMKSFLDILEKEIKGEL